MHFVGDDYDDVLRKIRCYLLEIITKMDMITISPADNLKIRQLPSKRTGAFAKISG